jgi:hypothetical protein
MRLAHGGTAWRGVAEPGPKVHLRWVPLMGQPTKPEESFIMTALTRSFGQISAVLGIVGSAFSTAVALHVTHSTAGHSAPVRD